MLQSSSLPLMASWFQLHLTCVISPAFLRISRAPSTEKAKTQIEPRSLHFDRGQSLRIQLQLECFCASHKFGGLPTRPSTKEVLDKCFDRFDFESAGLGREVRFMALALLPDRSRRLTVSRSAADCSFKLALSDAPCHR